MNYSLPSADTPTKLNTDLSYFKKLAEESKALAKASSPALVFVSISKEVDFGMGMIDPFDLFRGGRGYRRRPPQKQEGMGSGYFIDLERGYVLTNNHVIDGADEITLKVANGKSYSGKVVGTDPNTDIAVVQVEEGFDKTGLSSFILADSSKVEKGEFVWGMGAPFGLEGSLSFGIISEIGRGSMAITTYGDFLQTDASINPGNSGGPLINVEGKVVGMNTAIFSKSGGDMGIGFAVPSNLVRRVANNLINGKSQLGYIGVFFHSKEIDDNMRSALGLGKNVK
ncbi:MAG: trypsin-like peptidase domain-containing protein, partial [Zetaproteobacteria bacterium]|nr:trypsin-like peptidase domain-containing protein [Zetaproteobacteria bacterium]